jgi:hypothetical protein
MDNFWLNFLLEIALFTFLGVLYYFYQKRKIVHYEENKTPLVMGFIFQSCLSEKKDSPEPELDSVIEALDDYLHNRTASPPLALLGHFMGSGHCSPELAEVIRAGLDEIKGDDGEK